MPSASVCKSVMNTKFSPAPLRGLPGGISGDVQLPSIAIVDVARDANSELPSAGVDTIRQTLVVRGPRREVPDVQGEDLRVGVDGSPLGGDLAALGDDVGRGWGGEGDALDKSRDQGGGRQGKSLERRHLDKELVFERVYGCDLFVGWS